MRNKIVLLLVIPSLVMVSFLKFRELKSASVVSPSGRLNIVVYGNNAAWLLAMETQAERSMYGAMIPGDIYIETAKGAGKYPTAKLDELGNLEEDLFGFIRDSLESFMHVPVDGVIIAEQVNKTNELKNILGLQEIITTDQQKVTDLGIWDRFTVWRVLQSTVLAKENIIDISKTIAMREELQADGAKIIIAETQLLPLKLRQFFIEPLLAEEKKNVIVYNATRTSGLAQIVAAIVESTGVNVIKVDNAEVVLSECEIRGNDQAVRSKSFARLRQIFNCSPSTERPREKIGEIELYVGKEFSGKMFGKL